MYADLEEAIPEVDASDAENKVELDFRDWTEENKNSIPDFKFSQFFSQFPNIPTSREQVVLEIARKIIKEFNGSSNYLKWIYSLKFGSYADYGREVISKLDDILNPILYRQPKVGDVIKANIDVQRTGRGTNVVDGKIISIPANGEYVIKFSFSGTNYERKIKPTGRINRKLTDDDLTSIRNIQGQNISKKILQEDHISNPNRIPKYITPNFISKFTYVGGSGDSSLFDNIFTGSLLNIDFNDVYANDLISFLNSNSLAQGDVYLNIINAIRLNISQAIRNKSLAYELEKRRYYDLKIRWINEIAEAAKKKLVEHLTTKKEIKESQLETYTSNENLLHAVLANNFNVLYTNNLNEEQQEELKTILSISNEDLVSKTTELKESILNKVGSLLSESNDNDLTTKLSKVKDEVQEMDLSKYNYYRLTQLKNGLV
jgi:hypothetical protein